MTPAHVKSLMNEKGSAERKNDTAKVSKISKELGEWFMTHNHYKEAIAEFNDLVAIQKVSRIVFKGC